MRTSLYRHFDKENTLLYVGVSLSALNRLGQHADCSEWFKSISSVRIEHFDDRKSALEAEKRAIANERPKHNIQHKKEAERIEKERLAAARQLTADAARQRKDLTHRVVYLKPVYTIEEAAGQIGVQTRTVRAWIRDGAIGWFEMPNMNGNMKPFISGWQIIEFIESRGGMTWDGDQ